MSIPDRFFIVRAMREYIGLSRNLELKAKDEVIPYSSRVSC